MVPISWARVAEESGDGLRRPFLELMAAEVTSAPVTATTRRFVDELATTPEAERIGVVRHHVRAAIAAVLGLAADSVGDDVEFSELGMDSLMAVELRNRLERSMAITLGSTAAFEWPTVRALSDHIAHDLLGVARDAQSGGDDHGEAPAERVDADRVDAVVDVEVLAPGTSLASPAQRRFLFLSDFDPDASVFNLPNVARVTGELDLVALQAAFDEIVRRHEPLRTGFDVVGDEVLQVVQPAASVLIQLSDLRDLSRGRARDGFGPADPG